jgi:hypothetical protein
MCPLACYRFNFAGLGVASAWRPPSFLGDATEVSQSFSVIRTADAGGADRTSGSDVLLHQWRAVNDELTLTLIRTRHGFLLRFPRLMDFELSDDGEEISPHLDTVTPPDTFWHLLLDQVLPRALSHRRRHVVHAGGVLRDEVAIAFVGDTGAGKSTLAGEFARAGEPLLSDDALVIAPVEGGHEVLPTYPSLRLCADSLAQLDLERDELFPMAHYSDKRRIKLPVRSATPPSARWPLAAIYHLEPVVDGTRTSISPITPREAVTVLLRNSFQLDVTDMAGTAWLLDRCARLADQVPVFRLRYPRDFRQLGNVRRAVTDHVARLVD